MRYYRNIVKYCVAYMELATDKGLLEIKILRFDNRMPKTKIYRVGCALTLYWYLAQIETDIGL